MVSYATTTQLNAEIAARKAADTAEAAARVTGDSQEHTFATGAVAAEANVRVAADIANATAITALAARVAKLEAPGRALGVYIDQSMYNPALLDTYATLIGRKPAFATIYSSWNFGNGGAEWPGPWIAAMDSRQITPLVTWEPWTYSGASDPSYSCASIIAGNHNAEIDAWIAGAKAYGQPIRIRLAHEMNGDWYPWGFKGGNNGNSPAAFVTFWQYVVDRFRAAGATNVRWVWSPNTVDTDKPLTGSYPGDAYVDLLGIDGYNFGTAFTWSTWLTFTQVFAPTYDLLTVLSAKPIIIAETASAELGGDKAAWITSAYGTEIPSRFPRLVGVLWFNQNKETDWRVESSTASLTAYQAVAASPSWAAVLP